MVENAVYDDAHPVAVSGVEQGVEIFAYTEFWVDFIVVAGVVAVVGGGEENGVEVEGVHAELEEIIEFLDDAAQVAAHKIVEGRFCSPFCDVGGVISRVAVGETVGENLVENRVLYPVRDGHYEPRYF